MADPGAVPAVPSFPPDLTVPAVPTAMPQVPSYPFGSQTAEAAVSTANPVVDATTAAAPVPSTAVAPAVSTGSPAALTSQPAATSVVSQSPVASAQTPESASAPLVATTSAIQTVAITSTVPTVALAPTTASPLVISTSLANTISPSSPASTTPLSTTASTFATSTSSPASTSSNTSFTSTSVTRTSQSPAGTTTTTTAATSAGQQHQDDFPTGKVVGGVVGGFFGLLLIALILYLIRRSRDREGSEPLNGSDAAGVEGGPFQQSRSLGSSAIAIARSFSRRRAGSDVNGTGESGFTKLGGRKLPTMLPTFDEDEKSPRVDLTPLTSKHDLSIEPLPGPYADSISRPGPQGAFSPIGIGIAMSEPPSEPPSRVTSHDMNDPGAFTFFHSDEQLPAMPLGTEVLKPGPARLASYGQARVSEASFPESLFSGASPVPPSSRPFSDSAGSLPQSPGSSFLRGPSAVVSSPSMRSFTRVQSRQGTPVRSSGIAENRNTLGRSLPDGSRGSRFTEDI